METKTRWKGDGLSADYDYNPDHYFFRRQLREYRAPAKVKHDMVIGVICIMILIFLFIAVNSQ